MMRSRCVKSACEMPRIRRSGNTLCTLQNHAAILTKDEDFAERSLCSPNPPVVIWLRIGNATNASLRSWLLPLLPAIMQRLRAGDTLIEVR